MVRAFGHWLEATAVSRWLQDAGWVVPVSQSIHILCVGMVFSAAALGCLRVLGVGSRHRDVWQLSRQLLPWTCIGMLGLTLTGAVQIVTEPMRQFVTPVFWTKMALVLVAACAIGWLAVVVRRAQPVSAGAAVPIALRLLAGLFLLLWVAIIVCGRFIAYTYTFYS